jgi:DNA-binding CsgD family transcriptional regulator
MTRKPLTERELEIVLALGDREEGMKAIAARLNISEHTGWTYVRRAYRKLGVSNRIDAAGRARAQLRRRGLSANVSTN